MSMRCKLSGCDRDECGTCRRCGDQSQPSHDWQETEREKPCFRRRTCNRCDAEDEKADHQWVPAETPAAMAEINGPGLQCGRCGLKI